MKTLQFLMTILYGYLLIGFLFLLICETTILFFKNSRRTKEIASTLFPFGITPELKIYLFLLWPFMMKLFIKAIKMKYKKDLEVKSEIIKTKSNFQSKLEKMAIENKNKKEVSIKSNFQERLEKMATKKS